MAKTYDENFMGAMRHSLKQKPSDRDCQKFSKHYGLFVDLKNVGWFKGSMLPLQLIHPDKLQHFISSEKNKVLLVANQDAFRNEHSGEMAGGSPEQQLSSNEIKVSTKDTIS